MMKITGTMRSCNPDAEETFSRRYDGEGRLISERYVDRYNKLTNNAKGIAGWTGYYDEDGNLVITSCYDKTRNSLSFDVVVEEVVGK